jgi:hypothetical protein
MNIVSSRQRWAAWVMISFMATLASMWGIAATGERALRRAPCVSGASRVPMVRPSELEGTILNLELEPDAAPEILRRGGPEGPCVQSWVRAEILADFLFIPGYSGFLAFAVLLLAVSRYNGDPPAAWPWRALGILLAAVMLTADVAENLFILRVLDGRGSPDLWLATATKWGAVALAIVLAGVLALKRRGESWRCLMALIGAAGLLVGGALAAGVFLHSRDGVQRITNLGLLPFFLLLLIHSIVVMVKSDLLDVEPPKRKGKTENEPTRPEPARDSFPVRPGLPRATQD